MTGCCDHDIDEEALKVTAFRRILWAVLVINASMFVVEFSSAFVASSVALQADALDFLGDAATYGITLMVLGSALKVRARAALLKAASMALMGLWVFGRTIFYMIEGVTPSAEIMGIMGGLAFLANLISALMLYRYRAGDSNMRSIWLCSRNDAIGNLAIIVAALGVFTTETPWPDFVIAVIMASLAISASIQIFRQAGQELRGPDPKSMVS